MDLIGYRTNFTFSCLEEKYEKPITYHLYYTPKEEFSVPRTIYHGRENTVPDI